MAYFALLWKARTIERYRSKYEKEKIDSIIAANAEFPRHTFSQKWKLYRYDSQKRLNRTFRKWCPEGSRLSNFFVYLRTDQTFANFLLKSVIGFVGGIVLTYFWFVFFVFQLSISLIHATIMSSIIGVSLTLGLAFSYRIRCLVFLLIPQFFSRVGRYTLTCYALVLILTGPATNTLKNSEVLSESLACGQEQVKTTANKISKSMEKPLHLVKDTIDETMRRLKYLAAKVKELMVKIHRLTMSLAHVLQSSLSWLNSVEDICNAKLGSPYDHCVKVLSQGSDKNAKGLLDVDHFVKAVCFNLKSVDSMCIVGEFAKSSIVATIRKKLQMYSARVRSVMFVDVRVRRSRGCCNASRTNAPATGVVTEIRHRADPLLTWLSWSSCLTSLFLLLIIFRAKYYQQMFETRSRFDNRYVTKELRDLDLKRLRQGRETVLPLNTRERAKYVSTTSFRLLASERVHLTRSIVFMVITTFKLLIHMVADYSLYWVLMNIRFHGRFQTPLLPGDPTAGIQISGSGPLAGIVRVLVEALSIPLTVPAPSPLSCLPNPHPPDFQRYAQIGVLILLLWLFALFEPYGLRLRHVIMGHYRPERACARAEWLYNHIIRTRGCFLKYARRKLHREYKYSSEERYTFKRWLGNFIPCRCLRFLLRVGPEEPHCLLCGTKQIQNDADTHLKRCDTPSCPGTYCTRCFIDIGQLCTICLAPEDYGDLSDVSLEKSSSEDSDSDDDNDFRGVNKPLLGTSADKLNEHELFPHQNTITNTCERLPKSKNNGNQEATAINIDNLKQKIDSDFSFIQNIEVDSAKADSEPTIPVVIRDKEKLLKSVSVPKEKLLGVIDTMKLLTKKMDDDKFSSKWNMHESKTFEYLVMNLIQPIDTFTKALVVRQPKYIDSRLDLNYDEKESVKQLIPFLCNYAVNDVVTNDVINDPNSKELPPDLNFKNVLESPVAHMSNDQVLNKNLGISNCIKRNKTRNLEIKKTLAEFFLGRLRKRRIYICTKLIYKKRKRHNKHYGYLIIKSTCLLRSQIKAKCRVYDINETSAFKCLPKAVKKFLDTDKRVDNTVKLLANDYALMQDTKYPARNKTQHFSNNIVTDCSSNIKPSDIKYSNTDEKPNEIIHKENIEDRVLEITDCQIGDKQHKNLGFYSRLWMHTKRTLRKNKLMNLMQKHDPILCNNMAKHKRRKKGKISEQKEILNTDKRIAKQDNDDARNFRISLYLKDHQEWFKKQFQKDSKLLNYDDKVKKRRPNEIINNFLMHLKEKNDKRKMKEAEIKQKMAQKELVRQLKLKAREEEKLKRIMKKKSIRHKGITNVEKSNQIPKADQSKVPNKSETRLVKVDKTIAISSASIENKNVKPIIDETSMNETHAYALPQTCVSNCLNFFDFSDPPIDISEESIDLDEIFADENDACKGDFKESNAEMVYYNKRKHPQRPLLWPGNRNYTTQTTPEDVANERQLVYKTSSPIKIISPTKKSMDPDKSLANRTKQVGCDVKLKTRGTNVNVTEDNTRHKIIRLRSQDDIIENGINDEIKKTQLGESDMKKGDKSPPVKLYDFNRKRRSQNERCRLKQKNINDNNQRHQNIIWPTSTNDNMQRTLINTAMEPTTEIDLGVIQRHQKIKRNILPVRLAASEVLFGMKKPVDKLKDFYGTLLFGGLKSEKTKIFGEKGVFTDKYREQKPPNKKVQAQRIKQKSCQTQCENDCPCVSRDVGTAVSPEDTCTCAAQCSIHRNSNKVNVGTIHNNAFKKMINKETQYERLTDSPKEDSASSVSYTDSQITSQSETEETQTDTTICSVVKVDYAIERPQKHRRNRVKVVAKTNQSTITENVQAVDVSTVTSDWWSPIVEKKDVPKKNRRMGTKDLEKREKMNRQMETDGKFVSFKSYAQIIPADRDSDVMSPYRYLLESQRYYNELFCTGICSPSFPLKGSITKEDRRNDSLGGNHRARRSLKTKRLEECYSPRKKMQTSHLNLNPVMWRPAERKESPSLVLRRKSFKMNNNQVARKSRKLHDSQNRGMGKAVQKGELLQASKSFTDKDVDAVQCESTSSY